MKGNTKKSLFTTGKSWQDEEVSDFLKENKLFPFGLWDQMQALLAAMLHIPAVTSHNSVPKNQRARSTAPSHPNLTPASKSSVERLGCHRGSQLCPTASPLPPQFTPAAPIPALLPSESQQPLPAKPSRHQISFFSTGTRKPANILEKGELRAGCHSHMLWMSTRPNAT